MEEGWAEAGEGEVWLGVEGGKERKRKSNERVFESEQFWYS